MKYSDGDLALFLMTGQSADRLIRENRQISPPISLSLSNNFDLADSLPANVWRASKAAESYKLLFVFEEYLRELVISAMTEKHGASWWEKVPTDVQTYVENLEKKEETKKWMDVRSRDKSSLFTLPQLIKVIEEKDNWTQIFEPLVRDRQLLNQAKLLFHLRNTVCHMSEISDEEHDRIKMVMRDWFRQIPP